MANYNFLEDKRGFYSLYEGLFAILLLSLILISFNGFLDYPSTSLSEDINEFKTSQDLMEVMVLNINGEDSTLNNIKNTLVNGGNSQNSIKLHLLQIHFLQVLFLIKIIYLKKIIS